MTPCPPHEHLHRLLAEQLSSPEVAALSRHLEACGVCRTALDRLSTPPDSEHFLMWRADARPDGLEPRAHFLRQMERVLTPNPGRALTREQAGPTEAPSAPEGYELLEKLGRGGVSVVYKARDRKLKRTVALKMLLSGGEASAEELVRFRVEAEVVARLHHPHIVQIHEIGEHEGRPFLVLELVEGQNLSEHLGNTPLAPRVAAELLEKLARAIHYAHQQGVVHRDLKPANVLLNGYRPSAIGDEPGGKLRTTAAGRLRETDPKITDFGLAKRLDEAGQTQTGQVLGTPSYMAPEQARGQSQEVGPAADVYALGAILYQMVTGRPPFQGVTSVDTVMQVLNSEPVSPRQLQPRLPIDLNTICLKCLEKEPRKRYGTAGDLADDLRRFQGGEPIRARRISVPAQGWRWCRRHPALAALALVFVVAFLAVLVSYLDAENARRQEAVALQEEKRQRELSEIRLDYSRIALAENEWQSNNVARAGHLLDLCRPRDGQADRRDWEWHYLKRLCHADRLTRQLHTLPIYGLAFSPDGEYLVSTAGSPGFQGEGRRIPGEVRVWQTHDYTQVADLRGHTGRSGAAVFSPDGMQIASIGIDNTVRLWDVANWNQQQVLTTTVSGDFGGVGVAFSPDGKSLAVVNDCSLELHDRASGAVTATFGPYPSQVCNMVFSPARDRLVVGAGVSLYVHDLATRRELCRMRGWATAVAFSLNGQTLAAARDNDVVLYDPTTGQEQRSLRGHNGSVRAVAWSPDGRWLASAGADQTVRLWDPNSGVEQRVFRGHTAPVLRLAFHPSCQALVSGDHLGFLKVWDTTRDQRGLVLPREPGICDIVFTPDGHKILAARYSLGKGGIITSDATTGRHLGAQVIPWATRVEWPLKYLAFSASGAQLAAPDVDDPTVLRVWDVATSQPVAALRGHQSRIRTIAFSPDGRLLATGAGDRYDLSVHELFLWQLPSGGEAVPPPLILECPAPVQCLAFSPDGLELLAGERSAPGANRQEGRLSLWNTKTGALIRRWAAHGGTIQSVACDPTGQLIATGGRNPDRTISIWRARTGEHLHTLQGPPILTCLNFSPRGRRLAAVGYDGLVILYDPLIGQEVLTLRGLTPQRAGERASDSQVVFSPDGRRLAVNTWMDSVCIMDATPMSDAPAVPPP